MNFQKAMDLLKSGKQVTRDGETYLMYQPGGPISESGAQPFPERIVEYRKGKSQQGPMHVGDWNPTFALTQAEDWKEYKEGLNVPDIAPGPKDLNPEPKEAPVVETAESEKSAKESLKAMGERGAHLDKQ